MSSRRYEHTSINMTCANDNSLGTHARTHTIYKKTVALSVIGTDVALLADTEKTKLLPEFQKYFKQQPYPHAYTYDG